MGGRELKVKLDLFFFLGARLPVLFWGNLVVTRALEGVRLDLVHAVSTDTS